MIYIEALKLFLEKLGITNYRSLSSGDCMKVSIGYTDNNESHRSLLITANENGISFTTKMNPIMPVSRMDLDLIFKIFS